MFETTRSISYSASTASQAKLSGPMPAFLQNPHILVDGDNDAGKVLKRQFMNDAETPMGNRSGKTPAGADGADCDLGDGLDNDNASTEDADDEDEDADDEDDGETAVHGPPGHGSIESSAFNNNLLQVPGHYDHRAGRNTNALKRSLSASLPRAQFSAADLERARASSAVLESGDEDEDSDTYPRSNLQRTYSNSSAIRRDREKDETDDYDIDIEDIEDLDSLGDLSDDDIEKEEEMAIIEELASEPSSPIAANSTFATMSDLGLDINGDLFSDSDFDYELPLDNSMVWSDRTLTSQFFDFPSMPSSPISQPHTPPASPTPYGLAHQVVQESFEVSSDTDTDSEIEDIDLLDSIVKEPVRRRVTWEDTETSEEDEVWDAFFAPSTDDEAEEEDDEEETGAEAGSLDNCLSLRFHADHSQMPSLEATPLKKRRTCQCQRQRANPSSAGPPICQFQRMSLHVTAETAPPGLLRGTSWRMDRGPFASSMAPTRLISCLPRSQLSSMMMTARWK